MSEALKLAESYFAHDDAEADEMGWYTLLRWARGLDEESATWPDGTEKSQNSAFTAHITDPRSSIQFAKFGVKRQQGARFGDPEKARVFTI